MFTNNSGGSKTRNINISYSYAHHVFREDWFKLLDETGQMRDDVHDSITLGFFDNIENDFSDLFICKNVSSFEFQPLEARHGFEDLIGSDWPY